MTALDVVVAQEAIKVTLDFIGPDIPSPAPLHSEAFVQQRSVHALDEAVGAWMPDLGGSMLDVRHCQ
jgi:hypothetical protein